MKRLSIIIAVSLISAFTAVGVYKIFDKSQKYTYTEAKPVHYTILQNAAAQGQPVDFIYAAKVTTPTVVHIKTTFTPKQQANPYSRVPEPFRDFFGDEFFGPQRSPQPQVGFGSGIIISEDGYILTNNHVIAGSDQVEVTLHDKRSYIATVIGADPSTDIALVKVEAEDLPRILFGNSDSVQVGEWVVAVGNPFNFSSTVTAGIVSAKGRNIRIIEDKAPIESFIQTDAVVNKGNSGGALVNIRGELIGVNTAIASPTGTYAGYAFAVPVNLVKKVVNDLIEFGIVQRGFLGVTIRDIDAIMADELDLGTLSGVYVDSVMPGSAAAKAGVKAGDVITAVNGVRIKSAPQLQEQIALYRPGDKISLTVIRDEKEETLKAELKNLQGTTAVVQKEEKEVLEVLGIELMELTPEEKNELNIDGGVKVVRLGDGKLTRQTNMREGFVITKVNNQDVKSIKDLKKYLKDKKGGVMIEGVYPNFPGTYYYAFGM